MAKSIEQLWRERVDPRDIGNVRKRRALMGRYDEERRGAIAYNPTGLPENLRPISTYTVADGDTLSTIAGANGVDETSLLAANPDVNQLRTGMVLNTPSLGTPPNSPLYNAIQGGVNFNVSRPQTFTPGSEAWRVQNAYGPGTIPSNAAQGSAFGTLSGYSEGRARPTPTPGAGGALRTPQPKVLNPLGQPVGALSTTAHISPTTNPYRYTGNQMTKDDYWPAELKYMIENTKRVPSAAELKYLVDLGLIKRAPVVSSGGGSGYRSRRGGGGGGGRNRNTGGGQEIARATREPAFSGGGGFRGLVNWRI